MNSDNGTADIIGLTKAAIAGLAKRPRDLPPAPAWDEALAAVHETLDGIPKQHLAYVRQAPVGDLEAANALAVAAQQVAQAKAFLAGAPYPKERAVEVLGARLARLEVDVGIEIGRFAERAKLGTAQLGRAATPYVERALGMS